MQTAQGKQFGDDLCFNTISLGTRNDTLCDEPDKRAAAHATYAGRKNMDRDAARSITNIVTLG